MEHPRLSCGRIASAAALASSVEASDSPPQRRLSLEITLIAHPARAARSTLGRLRTLATVKSRTVVVSLPDECSDSPRQIDLTHWSQLR